jgi:Flp pilus assembly protein TadG
MSRQTPMSRRKTTGLRQAIRTFMVGEDGTAGAVLVEFSLLVPMLIVMAIYTMDYGLLLYYRLELQNVAQAGAQWAIANRVYNSSGIQTAAQNATKLAPTSFTVTPRQFCGCSGPTVTPATPASAVCTRTSTCTNGLPGTYVSVSAAPAAAYSSFIPYGLVPSSYTPTSLTVTSTVRVQ